MQKKKIQNYLVRTNILNRLIESNVFESDAEALEFVKNSETPVKHGYIDKNSIAFFMKNYNYKSYSELFNCLIVTALKNYLPEEKPEGITRKQTYGLDSILFKKAAKIALEKGIINLTPIVISLAVQQEMKRIIKIN